MKDRGKARQTLKVVETLVTALEELKSSLNVQQRTELYEAAFQVLSRANAVDLIRALIDRLEVDGLALSGPVALKAFKCACKAGQLELAEQWLKEWEQKVSLSEEDEVQLFDTLVLGYIKAGQLDSALNCLRRFSHKQGRNPIGRAVVGFEDLSPPPPGNFLTLPIGCYNQLLVEYGRATNPKGVVATLEHMHFVDRVAPDADTYEFLINGVVRSADFIKGVVETKGLPTEGVKEIAFLGLSNVGKSSLLNMVLGRKALARSSKKPGKTKEFNFFLVNSNFHLVDLPGLGYATVSKEMRERWSDFIKSYLSTRQELTFLFHLMDSTRDPSPEDYEIMRIMSTRSDVRYTVLLTKADKVKAPLARSRRVQAVRETLSEGGLEKDKVPIIVCSAEKRWGRDTVWMHLKDLL